MDNIQVNLQVEETRANIFVTTPTSRHTVIFEGEDRCTVALDYITNLVDPKDASYGSSRVILSFYSPTEMINVILQSRSVCLKVYNKMTRRSNDILISGGDFAISAASLIKKLYNVDLVIP